MTTSVRMHRLAAFSVLLCLIGAVLAGLALYEHTVLVHGLRKGPSFCNINSAINCDAVNQSAWSAIGGIPLASFGLFFYLVVGGLSLVELGARDSDHVLRRDLLVLLSSISLVLSVALFAISEFVIGSLCIICVGMYVVNLLLFLTKFGELSSRGWRTILRSPYLCIRRIFGLEGDDQERYSSRSALVFVTVLAVMLAVLPEGVLVPLLTPEVSYVGPSPVQIWEERSFQSISVREGGAIEQDYRRGPADAPVQVVEFLDFECPACRHFYGVVHGLEEKYPGKISVMLKQFPLDQDCNPLLERPGHRFACFAAQFVRCAGEQGEFWKTADMVMTTNLFEGTAALPDVRARMMELGSSIGLDVTGIEECLASPRQRSRIVEDIQEGVGLGVGGTPSVWVNGKRLEHPAEEFPLITSYLLGGK